MAFKMKGPSLLKMVKQMREGTPMKKDGEGTAITRALRKVRKDLKKDRSPTKEDGGKAFTAMARGENIKTGDLDYKGGSFDAAFADAKKSGAKTFTYNNKKYTTEVKKPVEAKNVPEDMIKIPKKKVKPLPVKTDVKLKGPEDRPDPTFEGTDEFRSLDEIRADSKKNK